MVSHRHILLVPKRSAKLGCRPEFINRIAALACLDIAIPQRWRVVGIEQSLVMESNWPVYFSPLPPNSAKAGRV